MPGHVRTCGCSYLPVSMCVCESRPIQLPLPGSECMAQVTGCNRCTFAQLSPGCVTSVQIVQYEVDYGDLAVTHVPSGHSLRHAGAGWWTTWHNLTNVEGWGEERA